MSRYPGSASILPETTAVEKKMHKLICKHPRQLPQLLALWRAHQGLEAAPIIGRTSSRYMLEKDLPSTTPPSRYPCPVRDPVHSPLAASSSSAAPPDNPPVVSLRIA